MVKKDPSPAKLRELVMQALYQKEISGSSNTDLIKQFKQNYKNFNLSDFEIYLKEIKKNYADFICLNFANPDMVGHTGNLNAAIKACETVDQCAGNIIDAGLKQDYKIIVIADHGNCETMINEDGSPNTAHTTNPVPLIMVDKDLTPVVNGVLGDIAPTILKLMSIDIPKAMTGNPLV